MMESEDCLRYGTFAPWYVSGNIAPGDAAALERHLESCPRCSHEVAELRSMKDTLVNRISPHVPVAELVRFTSGDALEPARRTAVDRHLRRCADCREDLRVASGRPNSSVKKRRVRLVASLVAALALLSIPLLLPLTKKAPKLETEVTLQSLRDSQDRVTVAQPGPWRARILLSPLVEDGAYEVRVVTALGGEAFDLGTIRSVGGVIALTLPTRLPVGDYRVEVRPFGDAGAVHEYPFTILAALEEPSR